MFIIYKIYYGQEIVYIGKTKQLLHKRIYSHINCKVGSKQLKKLDIQKISKVEYCECENEADMNLLEVYFIEKYKPLLNIDVKSKDKLTIELIEPKFNEFYNYLLQEWKHTQKLKSNDEDNKIKEKQRIAQVFVNDMNKNRKELSNQEYLDWLNIKINNGDLGYKYYKELSTNKN